MDAYEIEVGPLSNHSMIGLACFKWTLRQYLILFQNSQHFVKGFGCRSCIKTNRSVPGRFSRDSWQNAFVTHSNSVPSQMSMRKILTKREELNPPSTRLGILGHGPLGSLGWVESWKPVVQGKRRGGTGGANTVQYWLVAWSLTVPPNLWLDPPHQLTHCHQNWWRTVAWTSVSLEA